MQTNSSSTLVTEVGSLVYQILSEPSPSQQLYGLAWSALALHFVRKHYPDHLNQIEQTLATLNTMDDELFKKRLYDYRNAVGVYISIHILKLAKRKIDTNLIRRVLNISKEFNWYDRNGEVLTAAFLACDDLDKTTIDEIRKYMIEEVNKILNNKEIRRYLDLMYILFGLAYKSDPEVVSLMNRIWKNEALLDYLKFDPETLSLYFFVCSRMAYPRVKDLVKDPDKKDAQEEVQRLYEQALNLYEIIMIRRLEGASGHLGYNKAKEEKELGFFSRRIDLASKLLLAFADSGYIKPFHLSSHEWQIYEQVKIAIEKGRYVRSTELGIILIMLEILIMWAGWQVMQLIEQNSWMLFILGVTTSWMLCEIWNTGRLSYKTLFAALQKIISTIKECFGR